MRRSIQLLILILAVGSMAYANERYNGSCQQGGKTVVTSGVSGTPRVQGSYPQCQVAVYLAGTVTLAPIFSNNTGTGKANPFTANTDGSYFFYAANGHYDVTMSGGGLPAPVTLGDVLLADPGGTSNPVTSVTAGPGITVAPNTGAVVVTNEWGARPPGQQLQYLEIKPNTGNNTTLDWAAMPYNNALSYNFPPQTPGGTLNAGANNVTLTPVPQGVNGTDVNHSLYISGGAGAAESCPITGGGAVSGAPTGQVIINCANVHTGAWTVQSATGGIQEAICGMPAAGGLAVAPASVILRANVVSCGKTTPSVNKLSGATITGAFTILGQPSSTLTSFEYWGAQRVAGNFVGGPDGLLAQQTFATYWPTSKQYNTFGVVNNQTTDTTTTTTIGLGAWIRQNTAMGAAVALEPGCELNVPNGSCFGMNIVLGTNGPASGATNPTLTGIEVDIEGYYPPSSDSFAYSAVQYNVRNPAPAIIVRNGNAAVTPPAWGQAFYSEHGATSTALFAGTRDLATVNNNASQNIIFYSIDGAGTGRAGEMFANASGHLILDFTGLQNSTALKIQAVNTCTTAPTAGATCNTTVTWPTPFADTNYFPLCTVLATTGVPTMVNEQGPRLPGRVIIQISALTATAASGLLDCIGIHY
jgi:hypothetical protein